VIIAENTPIKAAKVVRDQPVAIILAISAISSLWEILYLKLRNNAGIYQAVGSFDELSVPPNFGLDELVGDIVGRWAMTVTKNWRQTFIKIDDMTIADLNLEDYH